MRIVDVYTTCIFSRCAFPRVICTTMIVCCIEYIDFRIVTWTNYNISFFWRVISIENSCNSFIVSWSLDGRISVIVRITSIIWRRFNFIISSKRLSIISLRLSIVGKWSIQSTIICLTHSRVNCILTSLKCILAAYTPDMDVSVIGNCVVVVSLYIFLFVIDFICVYVIQRFNTIYFKSQIAAFGSCWNCKCQIGIRKRKCCYCGCANTYSSFFTCSIIFWNICNIKTMNYIAFFTS